VKIWIVLAVLIGHLSISILSSVCAAEPAKLVIAHGAISNNGASVDRQGTRHFPQVRH
jgi:hypothetical protein